MFSTTNPCLDDRWPQKLVRSHRRNVAPVKHDLCDVWLWLNVVYLYQSPGTTELYPSKTEVEYAEEIMPRYSCVGDRL
ncbi:hypothetical protein RRG08_048589 [Elysia crispata]|uniref:Uncharacterized protein n=1 Tax=Elysia crispata TaxID=231223 RepID=A0AAE1ACS1_9GAST|nr:hypothetical protein RRG08_048589 [Elysia crispata]